jgi:transcriptional regulator with XRE-family HTH domain
LEGNTLGERLEHLLQEQHLKQKQFAEMAEITEAALSYYIKGTRVPRSTVLAKMATLLGTTTDYLLGGDEGIPSDDFSQVRRLIARNVTQMTMEEKRELINLLLGSDK